MVDPAHALKMIPRPPSSHVHPPPLHLPCTHHRPRDFGGLPRKPRHGTLAGFVSVSVASSREKGLQSQEMGREGNVKNPCARVVEDGLGMVDGVVS